MAEKKSKLAEIKTKPTSARVEDFINKVESEQKRKDSFVLLEIFKKATGEKPVMWGPSIIGFGVKRYKSPKTGREVDCLKLGFSPRKACLCLYVISNSEKHAATLKKLGKHKMTVSCLYINKLADVDLKVLKGMIEGAWEEE